MPGLMIVIQVGLFFSCIYLQFVLSSDTLILERANVVYFNKKYISNASMFVRRPGRNRPYYIYVEGTTLFWAGDNTTIHAVFYEYLHNEYKRSFVEFDISVCDLFYKEPWHTLVGTTLIEKGIACPVPPSLQVIPERVKLTYLNECYLVDTWANVRRYSRRGDYYINFEGTTLHTWGNNITIHLIFYEYLHNEYKRSFVEMHFKACELVQNDPYIGKGIKTIVTKLGVPCPAVPARYSFMNVTIPTENFPNVWPFEKGKVEVVIQQSPTGDVIAKADLFLTFKNTVGKKMQKKKIQGVKEIRI